jgi:hypothetical protein
MSQFENLTVSRVMQVSQNIPKSKSMSVARMVVMTGEAAGRNDAESEWEWEKRK